MGACVPEARPDGGAVMDASASDSGATGDSGAIDAAAMSDAAGDARPRTFAEGGRGCACRAGVGPQGGARAITALIVMAVAMSVARRRRASVCV
jgi:hypothetical protein